MNLKIFNIVVFLAMVIFRDELVSFICLSCYAVEFFVWFSKYFPKNF